MGVFRKINGTFARSCVDGEVCMEILFCRNELTQTLVCLENFLYGKIPDVRLVDSKGNIRLVLEPSGDHFRMSNPNDGVEISRREIECVISMILDFINQTDFPGMHYDFNTEQDGKPYSLYFGISD